MKSKLLRRHILSILVFGLVLILAFGVIVNILVARILIGDFESTGLGAARIGAFLHPEGLNEPSAGRDKCEDHRNARGHVGAVRRLLQKTAHGDARL